MLQDATLDFSFPLHLPISALLHSSISVFLKLVVSLRAVHQVPFTCFLLPSSEQNRAETQEVVMEDLSA